MTLRFRIIQKLGLLEPLVQMQRRIDAPAHAESESAAPLVTTHVLAGSLRPAR